MEHHKTWPQMAEKPSGALSRSYPFLIILACALAYANTLNAPFVFDDVFNIVRSPSIKSLWQSLWPPHGSTAAGRPVANFTFALNHSINGLSVRGYHLFNLGVHILTALLVYRVLILMFTSPALNERYGVHARMLAFFSSLIWAVHPLNTEAVTYISQRYESLMGMLFLATLYGAARGWQTPARGLWHCLSVLAFILGAGVKEVIVVAPFLVLLFQILFFKKSAGQALKSSWPLYGGYLIGLAFLGALLASGGTAGATPDAKIGPLEYLVNQGPVLFHYISQAFWPNLLCFDPDWAPMALAKAAPFALALVPLIGATLWALCKKKPIGFAGAWFFGILAPTSSIMPLPFLAWDRRMYLSLAALATLLVLLFFHLGLSLSRAFPRARPFLHISGLVLALGCAAALTWATVSRNADYQSEVRLWADTVAKRPHNVRARIGLGTALLNEKKFDEAVLHLNIALAHNPGNVLARMNLGIALVRIGDTEQGLARLREAAFLLPDASFTHENLAGVLYHAGKLREAAVHYRKTLDLEPENTQARENLDKIMVLLDNPQTL